MAEVSKSGAPVPQEVAPNAFPRLLMKLLDEEAAPDALWWLPDGKAFAMDPKELPSKVLDTHFRRTKFTSFIRRLHNTGFRRTTRLHRKNPVLNLPEGAITLSHDMFQRGAPHLLDTFSCRPVKEKASYLQGGKMKAVNSSGGGSPAGKSERALQEPGANLGPGEGSPGATSLMGAAPSNMGMAPEARRAQAMLDGARARLLQTGGGGATVTTPTPALANLQEEALARRHQLLNLNASSAALANPLPGLSFLQRQHHFVQESSMLRQQLLLQQLLQQQHQRQSHQPQLDLYHQLQQEQQLQRLREAAAAETLMGVRRQHMVGSLAPPSRESTDQLQLQLPGPSGNHSGHN